MGHEGVVGYNTVLTLHVSPLIVEAELKVSGTIASRNSIGSHASLVFQRDVLVTLRDEVRTLQVERPELACHDRLVHTLQRLEKQTVNLTAQ